MNNLMIPGNNANGAGGLTVYDGHVQAKPTNCKGALLASPTLFEVLEHCFHLTSN